MNKSLLVTGGLLLAGILNPLHAQPGPMSFEAMDADGNGCISAEEFATARQQRMQRRQGGWGPAAFSAYDTDGDGYVSPEEFDAHRAARIEQRASEGRPMRGLANAPSFSDWDTDGDDRLSPTELTEGQQRRRAERMQQTQ